MANRLEATDGGGRVRQLELPCELQQRPRLSVPLRYMAAADIEPVMAIERASFEFPWSRRDLVRTLRGRGVIGRVALTPGGVVAGYCLTERRKNRLHALNLAVDPIYRRRQVGSQLLDALKAGLADDACRRTRLVFYVREANLTAQLFLRSQGFRAIHTLRGFCREVAEDAYLFQWKA